MPQNRKVIESDFWIRPACPSELFQQIFVVLWCALVLSGLIAGIVACWRFIL